MKMKEATVTLALSPGFKNKYEASIPGIGHQDFDGRKGDLIVHLNYKVPCHILSHHILPHPIHPHSPLPSPSYQLPLPCPPHTSLSPIHQIPPNWLYDEATGRLTYLKVEPIETFLPFLALPDNATAPESTKTWMSSMFFGSNADKVNDNDKGSDKDVDNGIENGTENKNISTHSNTNGSSNSSSNATTSMSSDNTTANATTTESSDPPLVMVTLGAIEVSVTGEHTNTNTTNPTNNHTSDAGHDHDTDTINNHGNNDTTTNNNNKTGFVIKVPTVPPPLPPSPPLEEEEEDEIKINPFKTTSTSCSSSSSSSSSASGRRSHQFTSEILSPTGETVPLVLDHFTLQMQHLLSGINVTVPNYGLLVEQGIYVHVYDGGTYFSSSYISFISPPLVLRFL